MRLWPSSLRGRNALLIVALVLLGQLTGALLLRQMVLKPRLEQLADSVARNALAIRAGLLALPPAERAAYVQAFNERELRDRPPPGAESAWLRQLRERVLLTPIERGFVRAISRRLAGEGDVLWRRREGGRLELRLAVQGADYWIVLPGLLAAREFSGAWLIATGGSALLALFAALWLQRRMNRPLERVEAAARALAAGRQPDPLPEDGPREVATVSRSFNQMVKSLGEAERERALMLAGVSHDLRTPLTKLRLGVEILDAKAEPELMASLRRSIGEMDAIVGQFLDFARDEAAEPMADADLHDLALAVQAAFADHGRPVSVEGGPGALARLRPEALRRVVTNLVENAWRHGRPPVVLATGSDAQGAWLEVRDAGDGMDPAQAEALKQPFRRAQGARAGPSGSGLGLAIVERIVRQHGGRLELLRAASGGLCARVVLPRDARLLSN